MVNTPYNTKITSPLQEQGCAGDSIYVGWGCVWLFCGNGNKCIYKCTKTINVTSRELAAVKITLCFSTVRASSLPAGTWTGSRQPKGHTAIPHTNMNRTATHIWPGDRCRLYYHSNSIQYPETYRLPSLLKIHRVIQVSVAIFVTRDQGPFVDRQ